jgi:small subunit ribosomal protein S16
MASRFPAPSRLHRRNQVVRIRLKKFGTKRRPFYRIIVIDNRAPRDGKTLDEVGLYHPIEVAEKQLVIDADKVKAWLAKGAQPSDTVKGLMNSRNITVK